MPSEDHFPNSAPSMEEKAATLPFDDWLRSRETSVKEEKTHSLPVLDLSLSLSPSSSPIVSSRSGLRIKARVVEEVEDDSIIVVDDPTPKLERTLQWERERREEERAKRLEAMLSRGIEDDDTDTEEVGLEGSRRDRAIRQRERYTKEEWDAFGRKQYEEQSAMRYGFFDSMTIRATIDAIFGPSVPAPLKAMLEECPIDDPDWRGSIDGIVTHLKAAGVGIRDVVGRVENRFVVRRLKYMFLVQRK